MNLLRISGPPETGLGRGWGHAGPLVEHFSPESFAWSPGPRISVFFASSGSARGCLKLVQTFGSTCVQDLV